MALTYSSMLELGSKMPHFELKNVIDDKMYASTTLLNKKPSLIMVICNHCPYVIHYHEELKKINHDFGDNESIINKSTYSLNEENNFSFETTKNLKDDFTEYYDLIYTYITDCISINLNYNKSFYRDGNLEPNKSLSFLIKIIPFTELGVPNLGSLIGN